MSMSGVATAEPKQGARIGLKAKGRRKRKRFIVAGLVMLAALGYLIYTAVASNSEYYLTMSEVYALSEQAQQNPIKIGGKVAEGSIAWDRGSNVVHFTISDEKGKTMPISYKGVVPDSFQPGADVILEGKLQQDGSFAATSLLAKCASKYEPEIPGATK